MTALDALNLTGQPELTAAVGAALVYLQQTQLQQLSHLQLPVFRADQLSGMQIDASSRRNLELHTTLGGSRRGSLIAVIDHTVTPMGARLLRGWLDQPMADLAAIAARHDAVQCLVDSELLLDELRAMLAEIRDMERILARIALGRAYPRDYRGMAESLLALPRLVHEIKKQVGLFASIRTALEGLDSLAVHLDAAVEPSPPALFRDGGVVRAGFDSELDRLREVASSASEWLSSYELKQREQTGISTLKVKYNKVFGYFIEVSKAQSAAVPDHFVRKQTLVNCERYITDELHSFESEILGAKDAVMQQEQQLIAALQQRVCHDGTAIQSAAAAVATLDVLASFAWVARTHGYCRPLMHDGSALHIVRGRHPVVEQMLSGDATFVANDCT
ncbi:MAG: DNA mismatch repair protein MutS, partial [Mariprofundales bacterium]|nr:DNA mismatch repair protein MutS [Mariprofundales bacterium]